MLTIRVSECPCECPSCKVGSPAALGCCLSIHFVICVSPHFDTALSFSYLCCFDIADSPDLRPQILGRRPVMLSTIMLFALGSTICVWRSVKYEHAHCWKRFVLRIPDSKVL